MQTSPAIDLRAAYEPHEKQRAFHALARRFRAFIGGLGSGKTKAGAFECLRWCCAVAGVRGLAVAPTYRMAEDILLPTFRELLDRSGLIRYCTLNWSRRRLTFWNGSEIMFLYAERPEKLRGPNVGFFWLDEAALVPEDAFLMLQGRLRQRPGLGWVTTTPKGKNWIYRRFVETESDQYGFVRCRTDENPHLPDWFVRELRRSYDAEWAAQELDAQFIEFGGLIYKMFKPELHVFGDDPQRLRKNAVRIVAGVDWGYTAPGAIVVVLEDRDGVMWVVEEAYRRQVLVAGPGGWVEIALQLRDRWGVSQWFCDPSEPDHIQEFLNAGLNAVPANNAVIPGIQRVAAALEQGRLRVHESCINLLQEFSQYHWELDSQGRPKQNEKPAEGNDHALDALRYAVMGLQQPVGPIDEELSVAGGIEPDLW